MNTHKKCPVCEQIVTTAEYVKGKCKKCHSEHRREEYKLNPYMYKARSIQQQLNLTKEDMAL